MLAQGQAAGLTRSRRRLYLQGAGGLWPRTGSLAAGAPQLAASPAAQARATGIQPALAWAGAAGRGHTACQPTAPAGSSNRRSARARGRDRRPREGLRAADGGCLWNSSAGGSAQVPAACHAAVTDPRSCGRRDHRARKPATSSSSRDPEVRRSSAGLGRVMAGQQKIVNRVRRRSAPGPHGF